MPHPFPEAFARELDGYIQTLDRFAGRAFGHISPDTGFYLNFVTENAASGTYTGMIGNDEFVPLCMERDIPVLDTRPMTTENRIHFVVSGPMLAVGHFDHDAATFETGPLSYLPAPAFAAMWVAKGAILHGEPYELRDPNRRPFDGRPPRTS